MSQPKFLLNLAEKSKYFDFSAKFNQISGKRAHKTEWNEYCFQNRNSFAKS
jgi:hypothetical protein